jgi:Putative auto-transporter adhesin, head GIN domain
MTRADRTENPLKLLREIPAEVTIEQVGQMVAAFPIGVATATWLTNINLNTILMTTAGSILIGGSIYLMSAEEPTSKIATAPALETSTVAEVMVEPEPLEEAAVVLELPAPDTNQTENATNKSLPSVYTAPPPMQLVPEEPAAVVRAAAPETPVEATVLRVPGSSRTFDLKDFTALSVNGSLDVLVEQGAFSVTASGEEAPLEGLRLVVEKGTLVIDMGWVKPHDDDHRGTSCATAVKVMVRMPQLSRADLMGSGNIHVGAFNGAGDFTVQLEGSGDMQLEGFTGLSGLKVELAGSGDIVGEAMQVSGSTQIHLAGSGDIRVAGTTGQVDIRVKGSGDVFANDLLAGNATVEVQGSGDAYVHCNGTLKQEVMGSGDIHVSGSAGVNRP